MTSLKFIDCFFATFFVPKKYFALNCLIPNEKPEKSTSHQDFSIPLSNEKHNFFLSFPFVKNLNIKVNERGS